jgi:hypothetical protein
MKQESSGLTHSISGTMLAGVMIGRWRIEHSGHVSRMM